MVKSGYVLAGFETLITILNNFCNNKQERFNDNFTRKDLSNFFDKTMSGFLHSYGDSFNKKKNHSKHNITEKKIYTQCRNTRICDNIPFITDSGGFQISIGKLDRTESKLLLKMYYDQFLLSYSDVIDRAFILDIPPGPNCDIFKNFDDLYDWNFESYSKAASLPDDIRKKIIYVHHFRSPKLWDMFEKLLKENSFYEKFDHFATGGIVANMKSDVDIPCIIYILPLIPLLNETIRNKKNKLNFHILGGAGYRDVLFYEIFRLHILKVHNIKVNFTYDSSGIYKGLMIGRCLPFIDENNTVQKLDLRSNLLHLRFKNTKYTNKETFSNILRQFSSKFNFKEIDGENIYNEKTLNEEIKVYSMLYMLSTYSIIQTFLRKEAERIYPLYKNNNFHSYNIECESITVKLNGGKVSRKQKSKSYSIINSLRILETLDEDYCKHIVNKFLSKDEFINLISDKKILTI